MEKKQRFVAIALMFAFLAAWSGRGFAETAEQLALPDYMNVIVGDEKPQAAADIANQNVLGLDLAMFGIYDAALAGYQKNFLAQHPVILALFSNDGGKFILYRPGKAPLEAPPVPVRYQIVKSIAHSTMAIFELTSSHLGTVSDHSWMGPMASYRVANQTAVSTIGATDLSPDWRQNEINILNANIKFLDDCMRRGTYSFADIQKYTQDVKPYVQKNISWGATTQVEHWMRIVKDWKETLGSDWNQTYAMSNTLYVTRQNNILFSVLAQFLGKEAINTRLFLFETPAFVTTKEQMLNVLIRTVSDRSVGKVFFGSNYLMDYDLMGGDARTAIASEDKKYGMPVFLPPLVPFHSNEWPFRIDPSQGEGPALIEQIK